MKKQILALIFFSSLYQAGFAQGEQFFTTDVLHEIRLYSLLQADWDSIVARYDRKIYTPLTVYIDGFRIDSVGVRIKGNNFHEYPDKGKFQAYKLDFNEFKKGQAYDKLKKINLNNRDKLANHLAYALCRRQGIIAPRTSFSVLYYDDVYVGGYLNIEQVDPTFLNQYFGSRNGNLYQASGKGATLEYMGPDKEAYYYAYEKETNDDENDYSDLLVFLDFLSNSSDKDFEENVNWYLDFNAFIKVVAIEMIVCKRDAFYDAGRNFYLYHNPQNGKFVYIPDDFDYSFDEEISFDLNFMNDQRPYLGDVANQFMSRVLKSDKLRNQYYKEVCNLIKGDFETYAMYSIVDQCVAFGLINDFDFDDFTRRSIDQIRGFIAERNILLESDLLKSGYVCDGSGIDNGMNLAQCHVYPNPFTDQISVNLIDPTLEYQIDIFNPNGGCVLHADHQQGLSTLTIKELPSGLYFIHIRTASETFHQKVVKLN